VFRVLGAEVATRQMPVRDRQISQLCWIRCQNNLPIAGLLWEC
jgi:hypothetical protein